MRILLPLLAFVAALVLGAIPSPAKAQLYINIGAPPLLPSYTQPAVFVPNEIWTPGYWAWGSAGYYWVPGTWVLAPQPGFLYTPGYWSAALNGYTWVPPYWAPNVGYYGGVNYGSGYYGNGYVGGMWSGNVFRYNTAVTNVNTTIIRNVYINRRVVVRVVNRVSYNGGRGGLTVKPTPAQLAVLRQRHMRLTPVQQEHNAEASRNRNYLATVNRGRPPMVVSSRPLRSAHRPANFRPITDADRRAARPPAPHAAPGDHRR